MSPLVWAILYLVSVVAAAYVVFMIANKDELTIDDIVAGALIATFWPLVILAIILTVAIFAVALPLITLDDYCARRGWLKFSTKTVVWRRKGGDS